MVNDFQAWLLSQGYNRKFGVYEWEKDSKTIGARELCDKLHEWKSREAVLV